MVTKHRGDVVNANIAVESESSNFTHFQVNVMLNGLNDSILLSNRASDSRL